ncbi:hypothetical protein OIV83_001582 [Microbotryomycetes sp. JL201]|nr:hypothetical protein OIV83_001582 [Microbotryomycetes sp. JL201]
MQETAPDLAELSHMDRLTQTANSIDELVQIMYSTLSYLTRKASFKSVNPAYPVTQSIPNAEPEQVFQDNTKELVADFLRKAKQLEYLISVLPTTPVGATEAQAASDISPEEEAEFRELQTEIETVNREYLAALSEAERMHAELTTSLHEDMASIIVNNLKFRRTLGFRFPSQMSLFTGLFYYFGSLVLPSDSPLAVIVSETQCETCLFSLAPDSTTLVLNVPDFSRIELDHLKSRLWSGAIISFYHDHVLHPFIQKPDPPLPIAISSPIHDTSNPFLALELSTITNLPTVSYTRLSLWPGTLQDFQTSQTIINPTGLVIHDFAVKRVSEGRIETVTSGIIDAFRSCIEYRIRRYMLGLGEE